MINKNTLKEGRSIVIGSLKGTGLVLLWLALVTIGSVIGIITMFLNNPSFFDNYLEASLGEQIALLLPMSILITVIVDVIMIIVSFIKNKNNPYIKKPSVSNTGCIILLSIISFILVSLIEPFLPVSDSYIEAFSGLTNLQPWVQIGYVVIIGPILEEVLCRHMVIDSFKTKNRWIPIVVSAFLFGALHGNLTQGIPAFIIGLLLGYIYDKSRNLSYTIIFHIVFNLLGISSSPVIDVILLIIGCVCVVISFDCFHNDVAIN